jgi:hypothetical protein
VATAALLPIFETHSGPTHLEHEAIASGGVEVAAAHAAADRHLEASSETVHDPCALCARLGHAGAALAPARSTTRDRLPADAPAPALELLPHGLSARGAPSGRAPPTR